jgi:hypothetical protein
MAMRMAAQPTIPGPGRNGRTGWRFAPFSAISPQPRLLIRNGIPAKTAIPEKVIFADRCHTREIAIRSHLSGGSNKKTAAAKPGGVFFDMNAQGQTHDARLWNYTIMFL